MKCVNCGAENPDDKRFCGDCGTPLHPAEGFELRFRKPLARQIALLIIVMSVGMIVLALGFYSSVEDIEREVGPLDYAAIYISSELLDIAWLFAWLGIAGFVAAGFAYLLSLPIPKTAKHSPQLKTDQDAPSSGEKTDESRPGRTP